MDQIDAPAWRTKRVDAPSWCIELMHRVDAPSWRTELMHRVDAASWRTERVDAISRRTTLVDAPSWRTELTVLRITYLDFGDASNAVPPSDILNFRCHFLRISFWSPSLQPKFQCCAIRCSFYFLVGGEFNIEIGGGAGAGRKDKVQQKLKLSISDGWVKGHTWTQVYTPCEAHALQTESYCLRLIFSSALLRRGATTASHMFGGNTDIDIWTGYMYIYH